MLTAYLFDEQRGEQVDEWAEAVRRLGDDQVVWVDLLEPTEAEAAEVADALELADVGQLLLGDAKAKAGMEQSERYLRLTAFAVSDEADPEQGTRRACLSRRPRLAVDRS